MDPSSVLLYHYQRRIGKNDDPSTAYKFVTENFPHYFSMVRNRARAVGNIAPNRIGQIFLHRNELVLAGLHSEPVRGICVGSLENGIEVATSLVATYPLHNFDMGDGVFYYGGEGGKIPQAHRLHMRVLRDQYWNSVGNRALHQAGAEGTVVRLFVGGLNRPYEYKGLYRVDYWRDVETEQGRTVYEYSLHQIQP